MKFCSEFGTDHRLASECILVRRFGLSDTTLFCVLHSFQKLRRSFMADSKIVNTLRELINTCRDGEKGYAQAAEKIRNPDLKSLFRQYSQERGRFASQLEVEVGKLGEGVHQDQGHVSGTLHRACLSVTQTMVPHDPPILHSPDPAQDPATQLY